MDALQDPATLETMLKGTGGVPVSVQGVDTWGGQGLAQGLPTALFEARPGGSDDVVTIPTGIPPEPLVVGMALTVDGQAVQVLDHRRIEDGALTAILYGGWTHEVSVYRHEVETGSRGQQSPTWVLMSEALPVDIAAKSGTLEPSEAGRDPESDWMGRFPPGTDVQVGDGVRVVDGLGVPERLEVTFVGDRTERWKLPVELAESDADF